MTTRKNKEPLPKAFKEVCDYLGSDLDSPMCQEIKDHLKECPECGKYLDSVKEVVRMYREHDECLETPKDCKAKILQGIKDVAARKGKHS